ncbi:deazapurine DNA modification protein DpdA family protein [Nocardia tengchongensis]|uniref:deazapurine DNA modification protein DpdA family protein n=1 Tax=Nocardia tengchongensis TaxID=2055889 RepID=UPI0036577BED
MPSTLNLQAREAETDCAHVDFEQWSTRWGPVTPWTRDPRDPARRTMFYLGTSNPFWLNISPVPLFINASRFARYRSHGDQWPARMQVPWAGDSGAYTALQPGADRATNPWWRDPDEFGGMWTRFIECTGPPDFVGIQDFPCEPVCLRTTGGSVREHQEATLESYLYLTEQFPHVPWLATLQGWRPRDYLDHHAMYEDAGVEMAGRRVGIGSICRKGSQYDVAAILESLAPLGMLMHGFGTSANALALSGDRLYTADSHAWAVTARKERLLLPACTHRPRRTRDGRREPPDCRNCFRFALHYREKIATALRRCATRSRTADTDLWGQRVHTRRRPPRRPGPRAAAVTRPRTQGTGQIALFGG